MLPAFIKYLCTSILLGTSNRTLYSILVGRLFSFRFQRLGEITRITHDSLVSFTSVLLVCGFSTLPESEIELSTANEPSLFDRERHIFNFILYPVFADLILLVVIPKCVANADHLLLACVSVTSYDLVSSGRYLC